jgi:hypothetical protein
MGNLEGINMDKNKIAPITPDEVVSEKLNQIPDEVIAAFNKLIAKNWNGVYSIFRTRDTQEFIIEEFLKNGKSITINQIDSSWLDVEDIYRKAGWEVTYDQPGYNESYAATYKFNKR